MPAVTENNFRRRASRMDAHNDVVDAVRKAGMIRVSELAAIPEVSRHYADEDVAYRTILSNLRANYYPALALIELDTTRLSWRPEREGGPVRLVVFWKPLLEGIRRVSGIGSRAPGKHRSARDFTTEEKAAMIGKATADACYGQYVEHLRRDGRPMPANRKAPLSG